VKPPEKLYQFHVKNLHAVTDGLEHAFAFGRAAVARSDDHATGTAVRLVSFLLGAWSETRLLKLLYEPNGFADGDRATVLTHKALERWEMAVELAFRKHYRIPHAQLAPPHLPSTAHFRYGALVGALKNDLRSVITMRNKLAHGQWFYPLNEALDDVAQEQMDVLRHETLLSLKRKSRLLEILCSAVHDLAVSRRTFERDWDDHFRAFGQTQTNILTKSYAAWADQLRRRFEQGRNRLKESAR
jgi:hypothetical protein